MPCEDNLECCYSMAADYDEGIGMRCKNGRCAKDLYRSG